MTNFDRITESPETLGNFLAWSLDCRMCPAEGVCWKNQGECFMSMLEWLKEESETD